MIGTQVSHYKILKKLGEGGQGEVYQAEDLTLRRTVAIKFLPAELGADEKTRKRFLREAQLASALDHPNICTVYEINEHKGMYYIVMQFLEGKRLKQMVRNKPLDLDSALSIAKQLADALAAAHRRGVIHRDIKATNIIVNNEGVAKILDFGLAKATNSSIGDRTVMELTQRGVPFGTAGYMSPEQARGGDIDHRTDIFSLGVVLYEMVVGRLPFSGKSSVEVMHSVLHDKPVPVTEIDPSLPPRLQQIIEKAMAKDPSARYQSMEDFYKDIIELKRELNPVHSEEERPSTLRHKKSSWLPSGMMDRIYRFFRSSRDITVSSHPKPPIETPAPAESLRSTVADAAQDASPSTPSTWKAATDRKRSIAILPFKNLSKDAESDFYSFSLADGVITELAILKSLVVRPSSYIAKYINSNADPQVIGKELAVDAVLVATYLKSGNRFRVTPQLIDIGSGEIIWSDKIDIDHSDIISLQDKISHEIVSGLALQLTESEEDKLKRKKTGSSVAYELYLKGRNSYYKFVQQTLKREDIEEAVKLFQQAIAEDEKFALAHSSLGNCYVSYVLKGLGGASYYELAKDAFEKALQLDPLLVDAQLGMIYIHLQRGRKAEAREKIRNLLKTAGNDSKVHSTAATLFRLDGLYKQALAEYKTMLRINPNDLVFVKYNSARLFLYQKNFQSALSELESALTIEPNHCLANVFLGQVLYHRGDIDEAIDVLSKTLERNPEVHAIRPILAMCYSAKGEHEKVLPLITPQVIDTASADHDIAYWLASVYALEGDRDKAIKWFKKSIFLGNENYPWFISDKNWDGLRNDAEYLSILEQLRIQWEQLSAESS